MKFIPRSETTRQFIIENCAALFNTKGYAATSVTDLEKATNLTKGSIYGNFENKDAVAVAVFDYNRENKMALIEARVEKETTFKNKVLAHILAHYPSTKTSFTPGGCPFQNTAIEAANNNDILRKRAGDALLAWTADIATLIEQGILDKEFKNTTNASAIAFQIISLIEGAALFAHATRDMKQAEGILDTACSIVNEIST